MCWGGGGRKINTYHEHHLITLEDFHCRNHELDRLISLFLEMFMWLYNILYARISPDQLKIFYGMPDRTTLLIIECTGNA